MTSDLPGSLPETFTAALAREAGLGAHALAALAEAGSVIRISQGIYRRGDAEPADLDLIEIAIRAPMATICLETALAEHDLSDLIPSMYDIALPRGTRRPRVRPPVAWHMFGREKFEVGRELRQLDGTISIGIYSPERCIIDTLRIPAAGREVAYQAIRRYLRTPGHRTAHLMSMSRDHFPETYGELRKIAEIIES